MKKRSVAAVIILTLITCGIYGVYWAYVVADALKKESEKIRISPAIYLVLMLFVSSAAMALLGYEANDVINDIKLRRGAKTDDNLILWVVLGAFLPIVVIGLIQNEINHLPEAPKAEEWTVNEEGPAETL
ncbi:MAG: DUF4234 domain-containing protein [Ruminococcaceae bacterium]|nr:DUF4234 domain-containing protein [Oscillospiraceae bacterium]